MSAAKSVLVIVFLGLVYSSTAAPVLEADNAVPQEHAQINSDKDQTANKITSQTSLSTTETPVKPGSDENEEEDVNKEVTNYQTIERDSESRVHDEVHDTDIDDEGDNLLTDEEARELLIELSDSETVARFVVESDDAQGFLDALRLLKDQDYISLEMAYYLRDQVMNRLQRMLMIQEMDLSRTLLNNYEPAEVTRDELPNDEPPAPYYDFNGYEVPNNDFYSQELTPYEESLTYEKPEALNEIAEAVAQKIAKGELTPDNGVKILDTVAELLPGGYWQDIPEIYDGENSLYEDSYHSPPGSDYSSFVESVKSGDVKNSEDVIDEDFEDTDEGEEVHSNEVEEEEAEEVEDTDELESELKNRNSLIENALEKQLVDTAQNKDNIVRPFENEDNRINIEDLNKEDDDGDDNDMTDEDYEAFFDWLEREMNDVPLDIDDLEALWNNYESSKEDEHLTNES